MASPQVEKLVLKEGFGSQPEPEQRVSIQYVASLEDGTVFDDSRALGKPFTFRVGVGDVIQGLDVAVRSMRMGEVCRAVIPPELGYGDRMFYDLIKAHSVLVFEIELVHIDWNGK